MIHQDVLDKASKTFFMYYTFLKLCRQQPLKMHIKWKTTSCHLILCENCEKKMYKSIYLYITGNSIQVI